MLIDYSRICNALPQWLLLVITLSREGCSKGVVKKEGSVGDIKGDMRFVLLTIRD